MSMLTAGLLQEEIELLGKSNYSTTVGAWLPCGLLVDPWPFPGVMHNEYYVPRDENSHYYFQCGWTRVNGEGGSDLEVFNKRLAKFYFEEDGWQQEQPALFDIELLMWRVFAGDNARGIQEKRHTKGLFKR